MIIFSIIVGVLITGLAFYSLSLIVERGTMPLSASRSRQASAHPKTVVTSRVKSSRPQVTNEREVGDITDGLYWGAMVGSIDTSREPLTAVNTQSVHMIKAKQYPKEN